MRALLLTGPPGSGKTTVLTALANRLEAADVRHAVIEAEALAHVHPWPDEEAALDHLAHLAASFARRGYPLLLVAATLPDAAGLERARAALAADDLVLVRVDAPVGVLRERIVAREPAGWAGLERLLGAVPGLAASLRELPGVDLVLDTHEQDLDAVVDALEHRLRA